MRDRLHGIFPPIPTPFDQADRVDRQALSRNVRQWMQTGLSGVLAVGSNGEAPLLDQDECDEVIATVREAMPGRVLLAGTGSEVTRRTIDASKRAATNGADAVLVRAPSYYKTQMTTEALTTHFRAVADASPVPVLLYNLPGATGITLTMPVVGKLAEHPNIVGLKETSPELDRLGQFAQLQSGAFRVFSGWAPVVYPALVAGAVGGILAVANVLPEACVALYEHVRAGRHDQALSLQRRLTPLAQLVTVVHGIAGLKAALEMVGFHGGPVRAPLLPISARAREEIGAALAEARIADRRSPIAD